MIRLDGLYTFLGGRKPARPAAVISATASLLTGLVFYSAFLDDPQLSLRRLVLLALGCAVLALCLLPLVSTFLLPTLGRLRPFARSMVVVACLLAGLYLLTFAPRGMPKQSLLPVRLEVVAMAAKDPPSQGTAVELLGFRTDDRFVSYATFEGQDGWQRRGSSLIAPEGGIARMSWRGRARETTLIFQGSPEAGKVRVTWGGQSSTYDLYSPAAQEVLVHDLHPVSPAERLLTGLLFGAWLGFGLLLLAALLLYAWAPAPGVERVAVSQAGVLPRSNSAAFWVLLAAALLAVPAFLAVTRSSGLWIASDSSNYLSAARHLASGEGYIALDGDTYEWWPPLYPSMLAPGAFFSFPADLLWARLLNALLFGLNVFLSGILTRQALPPGRTMFLALPLVFFSIPLLLSSIFLLSEPLFNAAILGFLICLVHFLETGARKAGIFSALFAGLAALTRYAGVTVVVAGCLLLLFYPRPGWRARFMQAFTFGLAASLPTALWIARNYLLSGQLTGPRTPSMTPLAENLRRTWDTLAGWYFPETVASPGFLLLLGLPLAFMWVRALQSRAGAPGSFSRPAAAVLATFAGVYLAQLVISLSITENAAIGDRLLSPVFTPLTLLLLLAWRRLALRLPFLRGSPLAGGLLACLLLVAPLGHWVRTSGSPMEIYNGHFSAAALQASPLVQALRSVPLDPEAPVYSNCPRCMYVFADIHPAVEFNDTPKYRYLPKDQGAFYIVWFEQVAPWGSAYGERYSLPDVEGILGKTVDLQAVAVAPDGGIYRVIP